MTTSVSLLAIRELGGVPLELAETVEVPLDQRDRQAAALADVDALTPGPCPHGGGTRQILLDDVGRKAAPLAYGNTVVVRPLADPGRLRKIELDYGFRYPTTNTDFQPPLTCPRTHFGGSPIVISF